MVLRSATFWLFRRRSVLIAGLLATFLILPGSLVTGQQKGKGLLIGTTGTLTTEKGGKEKAALKSLQAFIKDETSFSNEIQRQKDWQELADKMAKGAMHIGVFQGFEFAWAQEKQPKLKPLAVAVNVYTYPVVYVVTGKDGKAGNFAALQGKTVALQEDSPGFELLFLGHECQAQGKKPEKFFSKVVTHENVEDCLDDAVDGTVQAAVADRAALEAFKRRKPGRFKQLKEVVKSEPLPPAVIAYYDGVLDQGTLTRFETGLLNASRTDRGQTILTLFRLTGFQRVPSDFEKVLAATRKTYPAGQAPTQVAAP